MKAQYKAGGVRVWCEKSNDMGYVSITRLVQEVLEGINPLEKGVRGRM